jgi:hypothetical protein
VLEWHGARDTVVRDQARTMLYEESERTFRKRCGEKPECINGIRDRDLKEQPRLGSRTTLNKTFSKTIALKIVEKTIGSSVRIRKTSGWTLRGGGRPLRNCTQNKSRKCRCTNHSR